MTPNPLTVVLKFLLGCGLAILAAALPARAGDAVSDPVTTGSVSSAPDAPEPLVLKHTVVLDPGHGGNDPGASSRDRVHEKDVVLAYALVLKQVLEETGRYRVLLTRDKDKYIPLEERVSFARAHKGELFIALHADMFDDPSAHGTSVYTVADKASDAEAARLADQENGSDLVAGIHLAQHKPEVANALLDLARRESKAEAMDYAAKLVAALRPVTDLQGQAQRAAAFVVLKAPDVPSVLVELGYLSNHADEAHLTDAAWRRRMALAMTGAVDQFFGPAATAQSSP